MPKNRNKEHRFKVYEACNYSCASCGIKFSVPENWDKKSCLYDVDGVCLEVDHIIPVSRGGSDKIENKQALCWKCNNKKSNTYNG